jgi:hypothetical protein
MVHLLDNPAAIISLTLTHNRRHTLDRRRSFSSLVTLLRRFSAVTLKLGAALVIILLAAHWQRPPSRVAHHGALSGEAAYRWHGFYRTR